MICSEGREAAFSELVIRYKDRLHNFLFGYTQNHQDCEDLVQETFLRVHKADTATNVSQSLAHGCIPLQ